MPRHAPAITVIAFACVTLAGGGCAPRDTPSLTSRDAHRKIPAIKQAVDDKDHDVAPQLVAGLDSDDPAVRLYSIQGLRRLTGETKGYRFYAHDDARRGSVDRWKRWLAGQPEPDPTTAPAITAPAMTAEPRDDDDAGTDDGGTRGRGGDGGGGEPAAGGGGGTGGIE